MSRINIPRLKTCTGPRYECQILYVTVFRALEIIKEIYKAPLFQLRIQMKKVIVKEQEQQHRYASCYVKNVDAQDHLIPRQTQAKIHLRGILHCGKDLIARQPAQSTVCSELSALNTRVCPVRLMDISIYWPQHPRWSIAQTVIPREILAKMKNQCENIYFEDCYLSHRGSN